MTPYSSPHLMFGSVTRQKVCQPLAPEQSPLPPRRALRLHQRDQLARHEREGHEHRRQHHARHREMILMSCRRQPGAEQALQPNSRTKTSPATTGDTENGRSISVISRFLPRKSNLAMDQAAATPKTVFSGTQMAAVSSQLDRRDRVRFADRSCSRRRRPSLNASTKTTTSGSTKRPRGTASAIAVRTIRARPARERQLVLDAAAGRSRMPADGASATLPPPRPALQQVDRQQQHERGHQHQRGDRCGAGIVELLELDDDQQRHDLGHARHVAGDEYH